MLPRKRSFYFILITTLAFIKRSEQYGSGAPSNACSDQTPRHESIQPQSSVTPYVVVTSSSQVRQGDFLNVTIGSPAGAPAPIGGFILQAREIRGPDKSFGKFTAVPGPELAQIKSCLAENDTVTHTNPNEKPALTFQWQAPNDYLGSLEFRATVAQSYAMFWTNVKSPLVEVVTPDTVVTTTEPPPTTRYSPEPPVIMESKPRPTATPLDVIYQGCGDTKLCFGSPKKCVERGNCKGIVAVTVEGTQYTFEMQATENPKYVASGLSLDDKMGSDSAMECVNNDGKVDIYSSWTYPQKEPYVNRAVSPQDMLKLVESSIIDGKLYCKFTRAPVTTVEGVSFDMIKNKYNLMIVSGDSMKDPKRVGFHSKVYESTGEPLFMSSVGIVGSSPKTLLKLHGCFMVFAWICSSTIGILFARYYKQTWVGKKLSGQDVWFASHRGLMVLTWLLTIVGFILILVEVKGWINTGENPHSITGIITVILCFIQPIGAYFRPHPGTKRRFLFNWAHFTGGNLAHLFGMISIFLAVYLPKAQLPNWSVYILAAFVVFHVLMHLGLTMALCVNESRWSGSARVSAFPMKELRTQHPHHPQHPAHHLTALDAPFSAFRRTMLGLYIIGALLVGIVMICLISLAPIEETYNELMSVN